MSNQYAGKRRTITLGAELDKAVEQYLKRHKSARLSELIRNGLAREICRPDLVGVVQMGRPKANGGEE